MKEAEAITISQATELVDMKARNSFNGQLILIFRKGKIKYIEKRQYMHDGGRVGREIERDKKYK